MKPLNFIKYRDHLIHWGNTLLQKISQHFDLLFYIVGGVFGFKLLSVLLETIDLGTLFFVFTVFAIVFFLKKGIEKGYLPSFQNYVRMEGGNILAFLFVVFVVFATSYAQTNLGESIISAFLFLFILYGILKYLGYSIRYHINHHTFSISIGVFYFLIGWVGIHAILSQYIESNGALGLLSALLASVVLIVYGVVLELSGKRKFHSHHTARLMVGVLIFLGSILRLGHLSNAKTQQQFTLPHTLSDQSDGDVLSGSDELEKPGPTILPHISNVSKSHPLIFTPEMFQINLTLGNTGTHVRDLQDFLASHKYLTAWVNSKYDDNTQKALKSFLTKECGWASTNQGLLGPQARECIIQFLKRQESKGKTNSEK